MAIDTILAFAGGDANDGDDPQYTASAYTNSFAGTTTTTLFGIDSLNDVLIRQGGVNGTPSPNGGVLTTIGAGLGITLPDANGVPNGFDIQTLGGTDVAFAALTVNGTTTNLYSIDLMTGVAIQIGAMPIGGASPLLTSGLAVATGIFVFSQPTYTVTENGTTATITVNRVNGGESTATVMVATSNGTATAPGDYTATTTTLTFLPGATSQTFTIAISNDTTFEANETVTLTLSSPTGNAQLGAQSTAVLTITNDDAMPTVTLSAFPATVLEGDAFDVTATLSNPSSSDVTVVLSYAGTTTVNADFVPDGTITIPAGQTIRIATVTTFDDSDVEGDETIVVGITGADGATVGSSSVTITITDNGVVLPPLPPGVGVGVGPVITINTPNGPASITPFPNYNGTVTTASGDINGDGTPDVIAGAGSSTGAVKVFDGATGAEIRSFFPFANYLGGTFVASGDIDGDGRDDIIIGATINGHVKVFSGVDGAEIRSFFAYTNFTGEARVSSGDIDGDGVDDVITGAGSGALGHVKVFSAGLKEIRSFLAYTNFNGGIFLASGDVNGDGRDDIITGAEANGHVKVFDGMDTNTTPAELRSFFAFQGFVGASRVASRFVNSDSAADIIVGTGPGTLKKVRTFDGLTLEVLSDVDFDDPMNLGIFVS